MANVKRTAMERQLYHFDLSKKGSCTKNGRKLSDFERGKHYGQAKSILSARVRTAKYYHRQKGRELKQLFGNAVKNNG